VEKRTTDHSLRAQRRARYCIGLPEKKGRPRGRISHWRKGPAHATSAIFLHLAR
jgi:hypothetical protein